MPTPCYISLEGESQGLITAGAMSVDSIGDVGLEGQRVHKPFVFTVALNKAVPLLYNALSSGEKLSKVELKWYRTSSEGKQENFFVTALEGAVIVDIKCEMPHCQDPANGNFTQNIAVSLAYRKITWDHVSSGTSGSDDWSKPIEA